MVVFPIRPAQILRRPEVRYTRANRKPLPRRAHQRFPTPLPLQMHLAPARRTPQQRKRLPSTGPTPPLPHSVHQRPRAQQSNAARAHPTQHRATPRNSTFCANRPIPGRAKIDQGKSGNSHRKPYPAKFPIPHPNYNRREPQHDKRNRDASKLPVQLRQQRSQPLSVVRKPNCLVRQPCQRRHLHRRSSHRQRQRLQQPCLQQPSQMRARRTIKNKRRHHRQRRHQHPPQRLQPRQRSRQRHLAPVPNRHGNKRQQHHPDKSPPHPLRADKPRPQHRPRPHPNRTPEKSRNKNSQNRPAQNLLAPRVFPISLHLALSVLRAFSAAPLNAASLLARAASSPLPAGTHSPSAAKPSAPLRSTPALP
jgi:hypothetical protein